MARMTDPLAGDEVRIVKGRHSGSATFIRHSARGAKAHVFQAGVHTTVPMSRITHVRPRPPGDRAKALEEPLNVADVMKRNLGEHRLAAEAQETHRAISDERDHARALHAMVTLSYHGHEDKSRRLLDMLEDHPASEAAAQGDRWTADLAGDRAGTHEGTQRAGELAGSTVGEQPTR
jgi:hypothetical protein